jgi:hypothetical protein
MDNETLEAKLYSLELEYNKLLADSKSAYKECQQFILEQIADRPVTEEISTILQWLSKKIA